MITIPDAVLTTLCRKFDTDADVLTYLGGGREESDGTVFTYPAGDREMVLKILAIPIDATEGFRRLEERVRFAYFLGQHEIAVAYPTVNAAGNLYETHVTEQHIFTAYTMKRYHGSPPSSDMWTPEFYQTWGRVTGRMHRATQQYPHWIGLPCQDAEMPRPGWEEEIAGFYAWCQDCDVKQQWLLMKERLADLPLTRQTYGLIHNDNHVQNILWNNGELTLLDFDVANCHFFVNDIAVMLQGVLFDTAGGMFRPITNADLIKSAVQDFMTGYEQEHHLDDFWLHHLSTFVSYRRLLMFTVMQEWLNTQEERKRLCKDLIHNEPIIAVL